MSGGGQTLARETVKPTLPSGKYVIFRIFNESRRVKLKIAIYCPQGSGTLRQQLLSMYGIAWYYMVLHAWYCMVMHGIAWNCMELHGIAWYCTLLHSTTW